MKKTILFLLVAVLIIFSLPLFAGGKKEAPGPRATTTSGKPQYGGTITTAYRQTPAAWDQEDIHHFTNHFINYIYDPLIVADWWEAQKPGGASLSARYEVLNRSDLWTGNLAESWDWSNPLQMTIKIRKGVKWHNKPPANGRELTAEDIVASFTRARENEKRAGALIVANVNSVTAPDKNTVVFTFKEANVLMLNDIGLSLYIECPDVWKTHGNTRDWKTLVGTGPWMIEEYVADSSITYKRNPDYFVKDPEGNQLPYADTARALIISDPSTQLAALRTGKIDKTNVYNPISWDQKASLKEKNPEIQIVGAPAGGLSNLWFRNIKEPFTSLKVRRALNMAVNRQELVDTLLQGNGEAFFWPAASFWPCFTPIDKLPADIREIYEWSGNNVERAKQLLAEAGYSDGFDISSQYNLGGGNPWTQGMELVKEYWAAIGVNLQLVPVDAGTASALRQKPFPYDDILGVGGGQESPEKVIEGKFRTGAPWNRGLVSDPKIDEFFTRGMKELDFEKRNAIWTEVYTYIAGQCYDFTFPVIYEFYAWHPWIRGYSGQNEIGNKGEGHVQARIWVDESLKKK